ncbi:hypothetical protein SEUCBS139899_003371 [Sporothrix eucalyptigena]|uniref:Quinone oxidoreductase n=1 Tax=Sporothrix eucalyptigena TaxID=1812306 RepID=A0ABP0C3Y1_9PEZI
MHYAQVQAFDQPPQYLEGPDLPAPADGQVRLKVLASAVHRLVQMRAKGQHFSARTAPLDPSSDGVGIDEATGQIYYIGAFAAATFAEYVNVDKNRLVPIPAGADPIAVAALTNPVSSSWMALSERVKDLPSKFSVLVVGVTGTSGRTAIPVARQFGAGKIIGAARNEKALQALVADGSIDKYIVLDDKLADATAALGHVDVILDYVYGNATATILTALQTGTDVETQYVNIGTIAQDESITLNAQTLRAKKLTLSGSAPGSYSLAAAVQQIPGIVALAATLPKPADVVPYPLSEVARVWDTDEARKKRLVLLPWGQ